MNQNALHESIMIPKTVNTMTTIYIGDKGKKNGNYICFISQKLPKTAQSWITRNDDLAIKLHHLVRDYAIAFSNPKSLPEQLKILKDIRDRSIQLRIEYSRLSDNDKNGMLLHAIENYQEYI